MPRRTNLTRERARIAVEDALHERRFIADSELPIPASNLDNTPVEWVFPGWIPAGKLSLLLGPFGIGKSLVSLDIAARISRGMCLPLCEFAIEPADVLIFAAQDVPTDTIAPPPDALRFEIRSKDRYSHPTVRWSEVAAYVSADMVAENRPVAAAALRSAEEFLRTALKPGRIDSRRLLELAAEQGIAPGTLRRARQQLTRAVRVDGLGATGKWMVELEPND